METIAFARGVPAPDLLAPADIAAAAQRAIERHADTLLAYGPGGGYAPLRRLLAQRHGVDASRVLLTNGSLQGFVLVCQHLFTMPLVRDPGSVAGTCIVERPTYDRPLVQLGYCGARVVDVAMDEHGMVVERLAQGLAEGGLAAGASMVYTIPTFHNPAGTTLSDARRDQLLELAGAHRLLVFEDDPYGELGFADAAPPRSLFERNQAAGEPVEVIYARSFSKTVSPGLRVGYMVLPERLAPELERLANDTYISPNHLGEAVVAEFIEGGELETSIEHCRSELGRRCEAMCSAIDELIPEATYVRPGGGYFLWLRLPEGVVGDELGARAAEHGVTLVPGSSFGEGLEDHVRLAFSFHAPDEITEGVRRLAAAVAELSPARA